MLATVLFLILYFGYISKLVGKVEALEKKVQILEGKIVSQVQSTAVIPTTTQVQSESIPSVIPQVSVSNIPTKPTEPEEPVPTHTEDFGSILAKVGIAVLVLGVAFFLNYINSKGWIGESAKFVLGLILGGGMIGVAEYVKTKSQKYAQILRGGGFIVWFLTIFVGSMIYNLFILPVALGLIIGIVTLSLIISLREKSETTFLIGILGAYIVPMLSGFYAFDTEAVLQVLLYICVINVGIVVAARSQDWTRSIGVGFVFSWLVLFSFYGDIAALGWMASWIATTICGLTFLIIFVMRDIRLSRESDQIQFVTHLTVLNTIIYAAAAYEILYTSPLAPYIGFLIALLGLLHFGVYVYIKNAAQAMGHPTSLTHFVLFVTLITAAVPIQFDGAIVTMIWFIEGVVLSFLASSKEFRGKSLMYVLGIIGIVAGIIHMVAFGDYVTVRETGVAVLNQFYLVWLFVILLLHGIAYIWRTSVKEFEVLPVFKEGVLNAATFLLVLGQIFFIGLTVYEIQSYADFKRYEINSEISKNISDSQAYYGDTYGYGNSGEFRGMDDSYLEGRAQMDSISRTAGFVNVMFFILMTVIYLMIGLMRNNVIIRRLGILTLVMTLVQLFTLTWSMGPIYRIASFIGFGIILLIVAYMYMKHTKKPALMIALMLSLASVVSVQAAIVNPAEWKSITTFTEPMATEIEKSWFVSPLDVQVWNKSEKADLSDIRIVDSKNVEIPYLIVKQGESAKVDSTILSSTSSVKILESSIQKNEGSSDRIIVLDTGKEGQVYTGINLIVPRDNKNFRKVATVYISDSLLGATSPTWREVERKSIVYNFTDAEGFSIQDLSITFPDLASRYIKIQFSNDESLNAREVAFANQIQVTGAQIKYETEEVEAGLEIKDYIAGNFDFSSFDGMNENETSIKAESIKDLDDKKTTEILFTQVNAITSITLDVDQNNTDFKRDVVVQGSNDGSSWQSITQGQVYRIKSPIFTGENLTIQTPVSTYAFVRVIVQNKNDSPLDFKDSAYVTFQRIAIIFKAEGVDVGGLKLLIGNANAYAPSYDIQKTAGYFATIVPGVVTLSSPIENPLFRAEEEYIPFGEKYKYLINISLVVFVALLGYLGYRWTKKTI